MLVIWELVGGTETSAYSILLQNMLLSFGIMTMPQESGFYFQVSDSSSASCPVSVDFVSFPLLALFIITSFQN